MPISKAQLLNDVHTHSLNLDRREIYIHSYYSQYEEEEPGVDYRQATTFIKNLHVLDVGAEPKAILIHMQSVGGCWDNGMAMHNAIQFSRSYVTILSYSQASSMSGIIFQSPTLRIMMPDCHFLMHQGSSGYEGHPMANKSAADFEQRACKRMLEIFANRAFETGPFFKKKKSSTVQTVYNFFDKKLKDKIDWYLDAHEAVHYGLADGILGSKEYPSMDSLREN